MTASSMYEVVETSDTIKGAASYALSSGRDLSVHIVIDDIPREVTGAVKNMRPNRQKEGEVIVDLDPIPNLGVVTLYLPHPANEDAYAKIWPYDE